MNTGLNATPVVKEAKSPSQMEKLPNELRRSILQHLPLQDLKTIRLTSNLWGDLGRSYVLSPTFRTLPHRSDITHLQEISHDAFYAPFIKSINFNHGEVNEYSGRHNSYFLQYLMEPEERLTIQHVIWEAYTRLKALSEEYLPKSCDEKVLTDIFAHLPNLTSLSISLMGCPFPESDPRVPDLLPMIWKFPSSRSLPRVATVERMTAIMNSASANSETLSLKALSHDRLPFEFWFQHSKKMDVISQVFTKLTSLTLHMDYSDLPNDTHFMVAFGNLCMCLRKAPFLKDLSLAFQGRRKVNIAPLLENFAVDDFTFSHLETLQFQGMIATATSLSDFLIRQKATLKTLTLGGEGVKAVRQVANGGIFLEYGKWKDFIARLREEVVIRSTLDKEDEKGCEVLFQGDFRELESTENWIVPNRVDVAVFETMAARDDLPELFLAV